MCTLSMSFSLLTELERERRVKGRKKESEAEKALLAVGDPSWLAVRSLPEHDCNTDIDVVDSTLVEERGIGKEEDEDEDTAGGRERGSGTPGGGQ